MNSNTIACLVVFTINLFTSPIVNSQDDYNPFLPSREERVLALSKIHALAEYSFALWHQVPDLDWDAAYLEWLPKVEAASTPLEYVRALQSFLALLKDGHSYISMHNNATMLAIPPVIIRPIEGRAVITEFASVEELTSRGIETGLEVIAVDGMPTADYLEKNIKPYMFSGTPQYLEAISHIRLLEGLNGTEVTITVRDAEGDQRNITLVREVASFEPQQLPLLLRKSKDKPAIVHKDLGGGIHYVSIPSMGNREAPEAYDKLHDSLTDLKGLVIDIRDNRGGNSGVGWTIMERWLSEPAEIFRANFRAYVPYRVAQGRVKFHEGMSSSDQIGTIDPRPGSVPFTGPIVVLTNALTWSAAEDFLVPLVQSRRATLVGEPTAGSTGQPMYAVLPGRLFAYVCSVNDTFADGKEFVGVGIQPDVLVSPTLADVRSGRDVVLETALDILRKKMQD